MKTKYVREGRVVCKMCARELDLVFPAHEPVLGLVVSRHLRQIEEYTSKGAKPAGFCEGGLHEGDPVRLPDAPRAKRRG